MELFQIEGILVFLSVDEIDGIEDSIRHSKSELLSCESKEVTDHRDEVGQILSVRVQDVELNFIPFNHFHHQYSFEIGLSITPTNTIEGVRETLSKDGYDFEFGYFDDGETECYLIPRWNNRFTPFSVSSYADTDRNPYLPGIRRVRFQVEKHSFDATCQFAEFVGSSDRFSISAGEEKRFTSIEFGLSSHRVPIQERVTVGRINLNVLDTAMTCSIGT